MADRLWRLCAYAQSLTEFSYSRGALFSSVQFFRSAQQLLDFEQDALGHMDIYILQKIPLEPQKTYDKVKITNNSTQDLIITFVQWL